MGPSRRLLLLLMSSLAVGASPAAAHPHVWIEASAELRIEAERVRAIAVTWVFDDLYSYAVMEDFDLDRDGRLDKAELRELAEVSRDNLSHYSFFTHLRIDGVHRPVSRVEDFEAAVEKERIVYRFTVPLDPPVPLDDDSFAFSLFDETYFVDLSLPDDGVGLAGEVPATCSERRELDQGQPLYFGLFYPTYVTVSCPG